LNTHFVCRNFVGGGKTSRQVDVGVLTVYDVERKNRPAGAGKRGKEAGLLFPFVSMKKGESRGRLSGREGKGGGECSRGRSRSWPPAAGNLWRFPIRGEREVLPCRFRKKVEEGAKCNSGRVWSFDRGYVPKGDELRPCQGKKRGGVLLQAGKEGSLIEHWSQRKKCR